MVTLNEQTVGIGQILEWARRDRLFAVVDATDAPSVPSMAQQVGESTAVSLYRGSAEEELFAIAPYLFHATEEIVDWLTRDLWSTPWGFLALAETSLDQLRTHLRRFLLVDVPNGESWYFRYYDPRVLAKFLPTCTVEEWKEFAGPIRAFGVTDEATYGVKLLSRSRLGGAPPPPPSLVVSRPS